MDLALISMPAFSKTIKYLALGALVFLSGCTSRYVHETKSTEEFRTDLLACVQDGACVVKDTGEERVPASTKVECEDSEGAIALRLCLGGYGWDDVNSPIHMILRKLNESKPKVQVDDSKKIEWVKSIAALNGCKEPIEINQLNTGSEFLVTCMQRTLKVGCDFSGDVRETKYRGYKMGQRLGKSGRFTDFVCYLI